MNNKRHKHKYSHYNQSMEIKQHSTSLTNRQKLKNINNDAIRITANKLPSDFFRPYTRDKQLMGGINVVCIDESGMKTPCFGEERKQSHSMSLIPKQKQKFCSLTERMETMPISQMQKTNQKQFKKLVRKKYTEKDQSTQDKIIEKSNQYSYRQPFQSQQRLPTKREATHRSTQRQKIKYHNKKLTLNDEVNLDMDRNHDHNNRLRLNIKKFFKEGPVFYNTDKLKIIHANKQSDQSNKLPPLTRE